MVTTRFFFVKPDQIGHLTPDDTKMVAVLQPDNDDLALSHLNTWEEIGRVTHEAQEWVIIKVVLPQYLIKAISDFAECDLGIEAVQNLGIEFSYAGEEYSTTPYAGLFWHIQQRFGQDLSGEYDTGQVDEEGQPIMAYHIRRVTFAGESI